MTVIACTSSTTPNWSEQTIDTQVGGLEITSIYEFEPTTNNYNAATTILRHRLADRREDVICEFDIAGILAAIPGGEVVKSALLRTHINSYGGDFEDEYGVDHLARNATLSQATWNEYSTGNAWAAPGANDATDIETQLIAINQFNPHSGIQWVEWDIKLFLKSVVAGSTNHNVIIRRLRTLSGANYTQVDLDNHTGVDGVRPELIVITGAPVAPTFSGTIADQKYAINATETLDISSFFSGDINTFSLSGAPAGTTVNAVGVIAWDLSVAGTYNVTVTANGDSQTADSNVFTVVVAPAVSFTVDDATPDAGATLTITANTELTGATVFGSVVALSDQGGNVYTLTVPRPQELSIDYGYAVDVECLDEFTSSTQSIQIQVPPSDFYFTVDITGGIPTGSIFEDADSIATGQKCYVTVTSGNVDSITADGLLVGISVTEPDTDVIVEFDVFETQTLQWYVGGELSIPLSAPAVGNVPVIIHALKLLRAA